MNSYQTLADCNVYTDRIKIGDKVGAGVWITWNGQVIKETCYRLPDISTIFQAEVLAIREAAKVLQDIPELDTVKFYVDSQAALRTLQAVYVKSKLVFQMIQEINKIKHKSLVFVWRKAHIRTEGNK